MWLFLLQTLVVSGYLLSFFFLIVFGACVIDLHAGLESRLGCVFVICYSWIYFFYDYFP